MRIPPRLPFAIALGVVSATGFAPLNLWPLTIVALAGLLAMLSGAQTLRRALTLGWAFGLGHFTLGLNWIATAFTFQAAMPTWLGWIAVVLLSIYLAVYPAIAAGLAWRWGRRDPLAFAPLFAATWMVGEWLRATMFTGFAWNPLGAVTLPMFGTARLATLVGTLGMSGLVALAAGGLLAAVRGRRAAGIALMLVAPLASALLVQLPSRLAGPATVANGPTMRVVQPNIHQRVEETPADQRDRYRRLARLTGRPTGQPRLILWPEAAVPDYLEEEPWARARLATLLGPRDVLLAGGTKLEWGPDGHVVAARNSLFALDAGGRLIGRYDKAHLVPYGEYLPMRPLLSAIGLSRLVPGDLDFLPGPGPQSLDLPLFGTIGAQICYEIIFSGHVVDAGHRPTMLFNPSNDAWFGAWGPPQHLAQARLRAIEEGLMVVRSTPNGISAVIGADGALLAQVPRHKAGAIDWPLPAPTSPTLFARFGQIMPSLLGIILVLAAIALRRFAR